jgi:hypothetical protein
MVACQIDSWYCKEEYPSVTFFLFSPVNSCQIDRLICPSNYLLESKTDKPLILEVVKRFAASG